MFLSRGVCCLFVYYLFIYLFVCLFVYLFIYLFIYLFVCRYKTGKNKWFFQKLRF